MIKGYTGKINNYYGIVLYFFSIREALRSIFGMLTADIHQNRKS